MSQTHSVTEDAITVVELAPKDILWLVLWTTGALFGGLALAAAIHARKPITEMLPAE